MSNEFAVVSHGNVASTVGLKSITGFEIELSIRSQDRMEACVNLTRFIGEYFATERRPLRPGERLDWGSSLLIARTIHETLFAFDELRYDGETVDEGVESAVKLWCEQSDLCQAHGSSFLACRYGEHVVVAPTLLAKPDTVEAIRYRAPLHMSGWWFFTESYDGTLDDFRSMRKVHTFELLSKRPELGPFLGLDVGFAFSMQPSETEISHTIWYEEDVASDTTPTSDAERTH